MRRDQAVADIALGSSALYFITQSVLNVSPTSAALLALAASTGLTAARHWVTEAPFSLSALTDLGLWLLYLVKPDPTTITLGTLVLLVTSFALTPSFKGLSRVEETILGEKEYGQHADLSSEIVDRVYRVAKKNGGISSLANIFQECNKPEHGRPFSLGQIGKALKELQELGEVTKLPVEGNVYVFPGITALNDPLTKSIVQLAADTGQVRLEDLILKLSLTPEVGQNALDRLEQFGIVNSRLQDGVRTYSVKGLAKIQPYTRLFTEIGV